MKQLLLAAFVVTWTTNEAKYLCEPGAVCNVPVSHKMEFSLLADATTFLDNGWDYLQEPKINGVPVMKTKQQFGLYTIGN